MKTGFKDLDILMEEEMEEPFSLVISSNEKEFSQFMLDNIIKQVQHPLAVLTERQPVEIDYVDCFTWSGVPKLDKPPIDTLGGPTALNNLSLILSDSDHSNVIFYTFSPFLIYNKESTMDSFLRSLVGKAKDKGRNLFFFIDPDIVDRRMAKLLETRTDYILKAIKKGQSVIVGFQPFIPVGVEAVRGEDGWKLV